MADARRGLLQLTLQRARHHHSRERRESAGLVDILDRRTSRPRRPTAGDRKYDVHHYAVSERRVRHRPHAGRPAAQVEIPA